MRFESFTLYDTATFSYVQIALQERDKMAVTHI